MRLERQNTILTVIDVQQRMMPPIDRGPDVLRNIGRLIRGCHLLGIPTLLTEQYPKGLGPTVEDVRSALTETGGYRPIEKNCFSAGGCSPFRAALDGTARRQVLVTGVETHVCVYQTCLDLTIAGFDVTIIADAVSSRTAENREIALRRLEKEGVNVSSTEMALFELLGTAGTDEFRAISKLVK